MVLVGARSGREKGQTFACRIMSALGQKQKSRSARGMSVLRPKADIRTTHRHVRFGPNSEVSLALATLRAIVRIVPGPTKPRGGSFTATIAAKGDEGLSWLHPLPAM